MFLAAKTDLDCLQLLSDWQQQGVDITAVKYAKMEQNLLHVATNRVFVETVKWLVNQERMSPDILDANARSARTIAENHKREPNPSPGMLDIWNFFETLPKQEGTVGPRVKRRAAWVSRNQIIEQINGGKEAHDIKRAISESKKLVGSTAPSHVATSQKDAGGKATAGGRMGGGRMGGRMQPKKSSSSVQAQETPQDAVLRHLDEWSGQLDDLVQVLSEGDTNAKSSGVAAAVGLLSGIEKARGNVRDSPAHVSMPLRTLMELDMPAREMMVLDKLEVARRQPDLLKRSEGLLDALATHQHSTGVISESLSKLDTQQVDVKVSKTLNALKGTLNDLTLRLRQAELPAEVKALQADLVSRQQEQKELAAEIQRVKAQVQEESAKQAELLKAQEEETRELQAAGKRMKELDGQRWQYLRDVGAVDRVKRSLDGMTDVAKVHRDVVLDWSLDVEVRSAEDSRAQIVRTLKDILVNQQQRRAVNITNNPLLKNDQVQHTHAQALERLYSSLVQICQVAARHMETLRGFRRAWSDLPAGAAMKVALAIEAYQQCIDEVVEVERGFQAGESLRKMLIRRLTRSERKIGTSKLGFFHKQVAPPRMPYLVRQMVNALADLSRGGMCEEYTTPELQWQPPGNRAWLDIILAVFGPGAHSAVSDAASPVHESVREWMRGVCGIQNVLIRVGSNEIRHGFCHCLVPSDVTKIYPATPMSALGMAVAMARLTLPSLRRLLICDLRRTTLGGLGAVDTAHFDTDTDVRIVYPSVLGEDVEPSAELPAAIIEASRARLTTKLAAELENFRPSRGNTTKLLPDVVVLVWSATELCERHNGRPPERIEAEILLATRAVMELANKTTDGAGGTQGVVSIVMEEPRGGEPPAAVQTVLNAHVRELLSGQHIPIPQGSTEVITIT